MTAALTVLEDWIIAEIRAAVTVDGGRSGGRSLARTVDSLGAAADADTPKKTRGKAPAVYVVFAGGRGRQADDGRLASRWQVYVLTGQAGGEDDRRRGSSRDVGAYELVELVIARLDGISPPDCGAMRLEAVENVTDAALQREHLTLYELVFGFDMAFDGAVDAAGLDAFVTFHADWDVPPHGNVAPPLPAAAPDAADTVTLEQA